MISSTIYRIILLLILWLYGKSEQDATVQRAILNNPHRLVDLKQFSRHNEISAISEFYWKTGENVVTGHNTSSQQIQTRNRRAVDEGKTRPLTDDKDHGTNDMEMFVCAAKPTAAPPPTPSPEVVVTTSKKNPTVPDIVHPPPHVQSCHNFTIDVMKNPGWLKITPNTDDFISFINKNQDYWTAGRNYPEDTPYQELERLSGNSMYEEPSRNDKISMHPLHDTKDLVEFFDARVKWPRSKSIGQIRDHGKCSSGAWALASTSTIADRFSIAIDTYFDFEFSAEDAMACCTDCTRDGDGCNGGEPNKVWKFWIDRGIVSGGGYKSELGCKPYSEMAYEKGKHEKCQQKCSNSKYKTDYMADRQHGKDYYRIVSDEAQIRAEIMINGPVQASFKVYADFLNYHSGVYIHTAGNQTGYLAVKLIGFGREGERQVPYWLAAHSNGANWGKEKGFFKILRSENHCKIEEDVVAGLGRQLWHDSRISARDEKKCSSNMNLFNRYILFVTFILTTLIFSYSWLL